MTFVRHFLAFSVAASIASAGDDFRFPLHERVSAYGVTNTWSVAMSQLTNMPPWSEKGEPPLSVGKAASLAKKWILSKDARTDCYITDIQFRSVDRGATVPELRRCWFYIIRFHEVYQFGSRATCVVLPDGSIVEPSSTPAVTNELRYLD